MARLGLVNCGGHDATAPRISAGAWGVARLLSPHALIGVPDWWPNPIQSERLRSRGANLPVYLSANSGLLAAVAMAGGFAHDGKTVDAFQRGVLRRKGFKG